MTFLPSPPLNCNLFNNNPAMLITISHWHLNNDTLNGSLSLSSAEVVLPWSGKKKRKWVYPRFWLKLGVSSLFLVFFHTFSRQKYEPWMSCAAWSCFAHRPIPCHHMPDLWSREVIIFYNMQPPAQQYGSLLKQSGMHNCYCVLRALSHAAFLVR